MGFLELNHKIKNIHSRVKYWEILTSIYYYYCDHEEGSSIHKYGYGYRVYRTSTKGHGHNFFVALSVAKLFFPRLRF